MILYLETSSLVKLYAREPESDGVRKLVKAAEIVATSIVAYAEARAAFARKFREKGLSQAAHRTVKESLDKDWPRFFVLNLTDRTVRTAGDLAENHSLRGFDALHLAAAMDLRAEGMPGVLFETADVRLREASKREGFETAANLSP